MFFILIELLIYIIFNILAIETDIIY
jgi:hypothetical protein